MMPFAWLSRLWGYLSKRAATLADDSSVQHGVKNESRNLNDKKNLLVTKTQPGDAHIVRTLTSFALQSLVGIQHLICVHHIH
jgi:arginine repressor